MSNDYQPLSPEELAKRAAEMAANLDKLEWSTAEEMTVDADTWTSIAAALRDRGKLLFLAAHERHRAEYSIQRRDLAEALVKPLEVDNAKLQKLLDVANERIIQLEAYIVDRNGYIRTLRGENDELIERCRDLEGALRVLRPTEQQSDAAVARRTTLRLHGLPEDA